MHEVALPLVSWRDKLFRNMAFQDHVLLWFHGYFCVRLWWAPPSPQAEVARFFCSALLAITALGIVVCRGELIKPGPVRSLLYRFCAFVPVPSSYLGLQFALPALRPTLLDAQLWAIDRVLFFGKTPAEWMAPFVTHASVEWFSFFYWSYLPILALQLIPFVLFGRGRPMRELLFAAMLVTAIGHTLYTFVPGAGPIAAMQFETSLEVGGFFFALVHKMVGNMGAQLDIFPSLHTALPLSFCLSSLRHRRAFPFRYTAPLLCFFCANIIIATLFLRWHYGIDVIAGILVASFSVWAAARVSEQEASRQNQGKQPVWEPLGKSAG